MLARFHSPATTPSSRGAEFGEAHAEQIGSTVSRYLELFDAAAPGSLEVQSLGATALERIRKWWPDAADEIEGVARGSGLSPAHVAAINARTEILGVCGHRTRGECSAFLALSGGAAGSFAAQTWDWHDHLADNWLVWTVELPDGRLFHTLTEYGILAKIGLNANGVAVLLNILHHRDDGTDIGIPVHVVSRRILETASNVNDALVLATSAAVSASTSLTIVGHDGHECSGVCVELMPEGPGLVVPERDGIFVRTNHFLSSRGAMGDLEQQVGPDTFLRFDVLRRRIAADRPGSSDACFELLRSHYGGAGAICAHPAPNAPIGARYATLATVVFDFGLNTMTVMPGGPCSDDETATFEASRREEAIRQGEQ